MTTESELLLAPLPHQYKNLRYTQRIGDGAYKTTHRWPQCNECGQELRCYSFREDPDNLDGFYDQQTRHYVHFSCYDQAEERRQLQRRRIQDSLVLEVEEAIAAGRVRPFSGYTFFDQRTHKRCLYCQGLLTDVRPGASIGSTHGYGRFMHYDCYMLIRGKRRFNPNEEAYALNTADETLINRLDLLRDKVAENEASGVQDSETEDELERLETLQRTRETPSKELIAKLEQVKRQRDDEDEQEEEKRAEKKRKTMTIV
jgi:hypothetical protein